MVELAAGDADDRHQMQGLGIVAVQLERLLDARLRLQQPSAADVFEGARVKLRDLAIGWVSRLQILRAMVRSNGLAIEIGHQDSPGNS